MNCIDTLHAKLEQLAATKGTKAKAAIVATFEPDELEIVRWALDPTINFYISAKTFPDVPAHGAYEWGEEELQLLRDLSNRKLSGNEATERVKFHMMELKPSHASVLRRVILKDLKAGIGVTMVNGAFPGLIIEFPYMRCSLEKDSHIGKWDWSEGHFVQLKANGMFANVDFEDGEVAITSRQGSPFPKGALRDLEEGFRIGAQPGYRYNGEILVYNLATRQYLPRQEGNGMLNSVLQGGALPDDHVAHYFAWDMVPRHRAVPRGRCEIPYAERFGLLKDKTGLTTIESYLVHSKAEALTHYRRWIAQGLEGAVLKNRNAIWFDGDSKDQVKLKVEFECDLEITGFVEGTPGAKTEKTFGSVVGRTKCGQLEVSVSGWSDKEREEINAHRDDYIGRIMAVKANEIMHPSGEQKVYSLFSPRRVEVRLDKKEADDLARVFAQYEAAIA